MNGTQGVAPTHGYEPEKALRDVNKRGGPEVAAIEDLVNERVGRLFYALNSLEGHIQLPEERPVEVAEAPAPTPELQPTLTPHTPDQIQIAAASARAQQLAIPGAVSTETPVDPGAAHHENIMLTVDAKYAHQADNTNEFFAVAG